MISNSSDDVLTYTIVKDDQVSIPLEIQKRRARIQKLRYETHATIIQSRWRGAVTRTTGRKINPEFCNGSARILEKCVSDSSIYTCSSTNRLPPQRSEAKDFIMPNAKPKEPIAISSNQDFDRALSHKMDMTPFKEITSVIFTVEGATGLPVCCTATRVSVRLVSGNRETISNGDTPSLANAECIYSSPKYSLQSKLEGKVFVCFYFTVPNLY